MMDFQEMSLSGDFQFLDSEAGVRLTHGGWSYITEN